MIVFTLKHHSWVTWNAVIATEAEWKALNQVISAFVVTCDFLNPAADPIKKFKSIILLYAGIDLSERQKMSAGFIIKFHRPMPA